MMQVSLLLLNCLTRAFFLGSKRDINLLEQTINSNVSISGITSYKIVSSFLSKANSRQLTLIINIAEKSNFPSRKPNEIIKTSFDASTQTFNDNMKALTTAGIHGERLQPFDSTDPSLALTYNSNSLFSLNIKLNDTKNANIWLRAINLAIWIRNSKLSLDCYNIESLQTLDKSVSNLHLTLKKIQSDRSLEILQYEAKIKKLEFKISKMYSAEEMHDLVEAHETELGILDESNASLRKLLELKNED